MLKCVENYYNIITALHRASFGDLDEFYKLDR